MLNMFRMDLYRLIRSTSFWVGLGVSVIAIAFSIFSLWYMNTPGFASLLEAAQSAESVAMNVTTPSGDEVDLAELESLITAFSHMDMLPYVGGLLLSGGLLSLVVALVVALFMSGDFETGFSKNIFTSQKSRIPYFFSKTLVALVIAFVYFCVTVGVTLLGAFLAGYELVAAPVGEAFLWAGLVILILWAFSMLVSLFVWAFRSKVSAVVVGIAVTSGMVGMVVSGILSLIPSIAFLGQYTLFASLSALAGGVAGLESGDIIRITCVALAFFVLYSSLGFLMLKKKDI